MRSFLFTVLLSCSAFASELSDELELIKLRTEQKVEWAHAEAIKYQQLSEKEEVAELKTTYLNSATKFFELERQYHTELSIYGVVAQIEKEYREFEEEDSSDFYEAD